MTSIHLFGSSTNTLRAMMKDSCLIEKYKKIFLYSRNNTDQFYFDFKKPDTFKNIKLQEESIFISCSPIWLFAEFIDYFFLKNKTLINKIKGIIVCSSTSIYTKRFANNKYDKDLYNKLYTAEEKIKKFCDFYKVNCFIIRPTIIYGNIGKYKDNNLSRIINIMQKTPIIIFPNNSGYRQPIHISQLSKVIIFFIKTIENTQKLIFKKVSVGGDSIITYREMLILSKNSLPINDKARKCRFLFIPSRLFYFLSSLLLIFSPRLFESILRIGSNLSGFIRVCDLLDIDSEDFPLNNL